MLQTIMIGANDANIAYLLNRYAQECGFQTSHISHGENIVDLACHLQPAILILDVEFAETAKWEIVRRLKAEPTTRSIPIVIYSCLNEPPDDWHEGVDGFLLKSALYADFVAVLERATTGRSLDNLRPNQQPLNLS